MDNQHDNSNRIKSVNRPLSFRGNPYPPIIAPSSPNNQKITALADAVNIAITPGQKVFIVPNRAQMTLLAFATEVKIITDYLKVNSTYSLGIATGYTTFDLRVLFGLIPYLNEQHRLKNILGPVLTALNITDNDLSNLLSSLAYVATLDDYSWTPANLKKATDLIGPSNEYPYTYRDEQWCLWLKYLLKDDKIFTSPPLNCLTPNKSLGIFHAELEKHNFLIQNWGIGTNGHGGFNEPGYDPLSKDQVVDLTYTTKIQNVNGFLRPDETRPLSIFVEIAGEFQLHTKELLEKKCQELVNNQQLPEFICHRQDQWQLICQDFEKHWRYLEELTCRIPDQAITQGIKNSSTRAKYNVIVSDRTHKSRAIQRVIEGEISSSATGSGLQLAPHAIWIIEQKAARYLKNTDSYFYLALPETEEKMFSNEELISLYVQRGLADNKNAWQIATEINEPLTVVQKKIDG